MGKWVGEGAGGGGGGGDLLLDTVKETGKNAQLDELNS